MTELDITWDSAEFRANLTALERQQLPFASALAITRTAQRIKTEQVETMKRVFDRPTPFMLRSVFLKAANKRDPLPQQEALVWFNDRKGSNAEKRAGPHVLGGARGPKGSEERLRTAGVLAQGEFLVLGKRAPQDAYGNINRGPLQRLLADLRAFPDTRQNTRDASAGAARWFVGTPNKAGKTKGGQRGIYRRTAHGLDPWFIITKDRPDYRVRFPFFATAFSITAKHSGAEFERAMKDAIASSSVKSPRRFDPSRVRL